MRRIRAATGALLSGAVRWYSGLARGWLIALTSVVLLVAVTGSVGMYRMYDYVQHDNDFCTGCHLMQDPFERFAKSAHRGLGCKACHRPNIWQRSTMGLIQIVERPDSLTRHAEVPSELCAECHVDGNPEAWKLIAQSAGHRVHLQSENPKLAKIECLTCHGAGVHEFATSEQSCGQSECHADTRIQLGGMSKLTIHCASCHDFNKPVPVQASADSIAHSLRPAKSDCLGCHEMRAKLANALPMDEPHNAVCGTCHNPHEQKTPAAAVTTCANGGCHQRVDTVTAMHRDLSPGVLQNCTACHAAHSWKVKGSECTSCHKPEDLDNPARKPIKRLHTTAQQQNLFDVVLAPTRLLFAMLAEPPFRHKLHASVACKTCHESDDGHGLLRIRTAADCEGCHHSVENRGRCTSCHTLEERKSLTHVRHITRQCVSCHTPEDGLRTTAACTSCHADHHDAARTCTACHNNVKRIAAHDAKVHVSCTNAGCHQDKAAAPLRTQRNVCLACHTEQAAHQPKGDCATCHMIPKHAKEAGR